jgi:aspartyl-tRNA(Asn)/glutamyl-tRNA(Gln) amidotransferase subunit B
LEQGLISTPLGKKILTTMYEEELGKSPRVIAEERGWKVISDMQQLRDICRRVIAENEDQLTQFKQGGKHVRKVTKFFVGKAMAASKGNAHPELLQDALIDVLEEVAPGISE